MILFVVVIVVAIIGLAGFSFVALMSTENKAVRLEGDDLQLDNVIASGKELLKAFLAQPRQLWDDAGGAYDNPDMLRAVLVLDDPRTGRRGRFSIVSPRVEDDEIRGIRFGVENESARLNLAVLLNWELRWPGSGRQALLRLPGMTESIADAILDWMDPDAEPRQLGAEADYYAGRNVPYGPRNAVPVSLEELLLVRGVTRDLLFGADTNFNFQIDSDEISTVTDRMDSLRSGTSLPWGSLLTVHSAERNLTPEGQPRIDLNDANLATLYRRLTGIFDERTAEFIVAYRQFGPYRGAGAGTRDAVFHLDPTVAPKFKFSSVLDLVGARVRVPTPLARTYALLESPMANDSQAMREYLPKLLDYTSVANSRVITGRINVNLAPKVVLHCVPGFDDPLVSRILAARSSQDGREPAEHQYPTWLLTEGLVDLPLMKALLPYLTTGGDVFRAQIVGFFDTPGPAARVELVIDATSSPPRQVYWKDLRILGRGYPTEAVGEPAANP